MYCDPISGIKELEIVSFYFCVLQIETRNDTLLVFILSCFLQISSAFKDLLFQGIFFRFTTVSLE